MAPPIESGANPSVQIEAARIAQASVPPQHTPGQYHPEKSALVSPTELAELGALRIEADAGDPVAAGKLERRTQELHAREMAALASDVYDAAAGVGTAPVGWQRASTDPALLARHGLAPEDLDPGAKSEFRAELYVPEPDGPLGPDAKPVLVFKGTTPDSVEDWINNFTQGVGGQSDYYDRAMNAAVKFDQATGGEGEFAGHSLGGGMASAAAAVTGMETTTFNAAGLNEATAARFMAERGQLPKDADAVTTAYQVDGEILTSVQSVAGAITPENADQMVGVVQAAINRIPQAEALLDRVDALDARLEADPVSQTGWGALDRRVNQGIDDALAKLQAVRPTVDTLVALRDSGRLDTLAQATGEDLRAMAQAAGTAVPLPATYGDGAGRPGVPPLRGEGSLLDDLQTAITEAGDIREASRQSGRAWDRRLGPVDERLGLDLPQAGDTVGAIKAGAHVFSELDGFGGLSDRAGAAGERTARHGMDVVQDSMSHLWGARPGYAPSGALR